jgi:head-tail adaptor
VISALGEIEAGALQNQVHFEHVEDTRRFLGMFLCTLADERERWTAARARHDHAAAAESAAEMRELVVLAGVCRDHLRAVRSVIGAL